MSTPPKPAKRRRIAGESKPGEAPAPAPEIADTVEEVTRPKLAKPKLPKREKSTAKVEEPVEAGDPEGPTPEPESEPSPSTWELPAAPPRPESVRAPRKKPSVLLVALLTVAIVSLGFATFGAWWGLKEWRADDIAASREAASDAAATASETIFTYQYNKLDAHVRNSQKLMTPKFAKKFKSVSPALNALAPQRKIRVKAVVRNAATIECGENCSPDKANVLVFIDQARVADNSDKPVVFGNRIRVSMVNIDGKWLVSDIKAL